MLLAALLLAVSFQRAAPASEDPLAPGSFTIVDGARTCVVYPDGRGLCRRRGARNWPFRLPVDDGEIRAMSFTRVEGDLLIAYELDDGDGGWYQLVRMRRGARTPAWKVHIPSFDVDAPVVSGSDVIVTWRVREATSTECWSIETGRSARCP